MVTLAVFALPATQAQAANCYSIFNCSSSEQGGCGQYGTCTRMGDSEVFVCVCKAKNLQDTFEAKLQLRHYFSHVVFVRRTAIRVWLSTFRDVRTLPKMSRQIC